MKILLSSPSGKIKYTVKTRHGIIDTVYENNSNINGGAGYIYRGAWQKEIKKYNTYDKLGVLKKLKLNAPKDFNEKLLPKLDKDVYEIELMLLAENKTDSELIYELLVKVKKLESEITELWLR